MKDDKIIYQISQDTELYEWDLLTAPNAGSPLGFSQNFYELAVNNLDGYIYTSSTDFSLMELLTSMIKIIILLNHLILQ